MKQFLLVLSVTGLLSSCGSDQSKAVNDAKNIQAEIQKTKPGSVAATEDGWTMTAKINGKVWTATSMIPPDRAGRIFGENNGESISLPYYDRRSFLAEKKTKLGKGVDMMLNDDVKLWGSKEGELEITKVDDKWAEGKFYFTASGFQTDKTMEVTDGFFRISMEKQQ